VNDEAVQFFNSSASYRVRIALALKGIDYQSVGVNIRIGQQNALAYRRLNPVAWCQRWLPMTVNLSASRWRLPTGWIGTIRSRRCCLLTFRRAVRCWKLFTPSPAIFTHK
jgi:hypothetical protein